GGSLLFGSEALRRGKNQMKTCACGTGCSSVRKDGRSEHDPKLGSRDDADIQTLHPARNKGRSAGPHGPGFSPGTGYIGRQGPHIERFRKKRVRPTSWRG